MAELAVAVILIVVAAIALRVAPEHHRFAVFVGGEFRGLKGPGLLVRMPAPGTVWLRLRVGDRVEVISKDLAKVGGLHVPVVTASGRVATPMRIQAFQGDRIVIGPPNES